eukprot:TRINITY_DN3252_c0_g2_i3.p1 TRINITY_DN3252_c0_g2~~TRINITY_DN3252_c0_g2_i3.p1  ORF type:complete len:106 (+),score=11.54 TRINITY_DN3252_c0_g2_i3:321-638(+)
MGFSSSSSLSDLSEAVAEATAEAPSPPTEAAAAAAAVASSPVTDAAAAASAVAPMRSSILTPANAVAFAIQYWVPTPTVNKQITNIAFTISQKSLKKFTLQGHKF